MICLYPLLSLLGMRLATWLMSSLLLLRRTVPLFPKAIVIAVIAIISIIAIIATMVIVVVNGDTLDARARFHLSVRVLGTTTLVGGGQGVAIHSIVTTMEVVVGYVLISSSAGRGLLLACSRGLLWQLFLSCWVERGPLEGPGMEVPRAPSHQSGCSSPTSAPVLRALTA